MQVKRNKCYELEKRDEPLGRDQRLGHGEASSPSYLPSNPPPPSLDMTSRCVCTYKDKIKWDAGQSISMHITATGD